MANMATTLAVKQPSMKAEWMLYELGRIIWVIDRRRWGEPLRDYPGEGLLVVPGVDRGSVAEALYAIDDRWTDQLEILDADDATTDRLLGNTIGRNHTHHQAA